MCSCERLEGGDDRVVAATQSGRQELSLLLWRGNHRLAVWPRPRFPTLAFRALVR